MRLFFGRNTFELAHCVLRLQSGSKYNTTHGQFRCPAMTFKPRLAFGPRGEPTRTRTSTWHWEWGAELRRNTPETELFQLGHSSVVGTAVEFTPGNSGGLHKTAACCTTYRGHL